LDKLSSVSKVASIKTRFNTRLTKSLIICISTIITKGTYGKNFGEDGRIPRKG